MRLALLVALVLACACAAAAPSMLWFDEARPNAQSQQALDLLRDAAADGLEPADYDATGLRRAFDAAREAARSAAPQPAETRARLEAELTRAMERLLTDLHRGRIDPHAISVLYRRPRPTVDAASTLRAALAAQRLPQAVRDAAPQWELYEDLRRMLAEYRALGAHPAWHRPLPVAQRGRLDPGQSYAGLEQLAQRLQALGDLPAGTELPALYEGALVEAVRAFQRRHDLIDDGIVGPATRAALAVTPAQRAQQIALALERLRWTPLTQGARIIVVNLPEFRLRGYEVRDGWPQEQIQMRVVVGRTADWRTPQINADLRTVEINPYWDVPRSIAAETVVPRLRADPAKFTRDGFEVVTADGRVLAQPSADLLQAVLRGEARIRQRPGPANALGRFKFELPNPQAIYLHDTPERQLFERARRDFSHGCVRVEDPMALAQFALRDQPQWSEARIRDAMARERTRRAHLDQPVPVLIAYVTAWVIDGRPHFFADLYGHDGVLARALQRHSAAAAGRGAAAPAR